MRIVEPGLAIHLLLRVVYDALAFVGLTTSLSDSGHPGAACFACSCATPAQHELFGARARGEIQPRVPAVHEVGQRRCPMQRRWQLASLGAGDPSSRSINAWWPSLIITGRQRAYARGPTVVEPYHTPPRPRCSATVSRATRTMKRIRIWPARRAPSARSRAQHRRLPYPSGVLPEAAPSMAGCMQQGTAG